VCPVSISRATPGQLARIKRSAGTLALILTFSPGEKEKPLCISGFANQRPARSVAQHFKAAVNAPQSRRFAQIENARQSRNVWSARVFSTAFQNGISVRQIQPCEFSMRRRTVLPPLGGGAGMRECVWSNRRFPQSSGQIKTLPTGRGENRSKRFLRIFDVIRAANPYG